MSSHAHGLEEFEGHGRSNIGVEALKAARERAQERWKARETERAREAQLVTTQETKRAELLANLELFCQQKGLELGSVRASDEPKLAHAIHEFVTRVVHNRANSLRQHQEVDTQSTPAKIHTIPAAPIRRRIDEHYTEVGLSRRTKPEELRTADDKLLGERKNKVFATVYLHDEPDSEIEVGSSTSQARYITYPEIGIVMQVRDICNDHGYLFAADGAEIVQSSYGQRFMDLVSYGGVILEDGKGSVHGIQRNFDIPDDPEIQAEVYPRGNSQTE